MIITTNANQFAADLKKVGRQLPFAISLAVGNIALEIQREQVKHMNRIFTVREPSFIGRPESPHNSAIRRTMKSTVARPIAELTVMPRGGLARADVLTRHEDDSHRIGLGGRLAIPIDARPSERARIPTSLRPSKLGPFVGTGRVKKGKRRTILVEIGGGRGLILQREGTRRKHGRRGRGAQGPAPSGMRVLYYLRTQTKLDQRLDFHENAEKVFVSRFPGIMSEALARALRTAR